MQCHRCLSQLANKGIFIELILMKFLDNKTDNRSKFCINILDD